MNGESIPERCTWCDAPVPAEDGYRVSSLADGGRAVFCRLEHVVPWSLTGGAWDGPGIGRDSGTIFSEGVEDSGRCAACEAMLGDGRVVLIRHRGEHRIADGFCSVDHLNEWAKAGGRWAA